MIYKLTLTKVSIYTPALKVTRFTNNCHGGLSEYVFVFQIYRTKLLFLLHSTLQLDFQRKQRKNDYCFLFTLFTLRNVVTKWLRSIHPVSNRTARFSNFEEASVGRVWQNRWYSRWQGWNDVFHGPRMAERELEPSCTSRVLSTCKSDF